MVREVRDRRVKKAETSNSLAGAVLAWFVVAAVLVGLGVLASRLFEWQPPVIKLSAAASVLGSKTDLVATVSDQGSGVKEVQAVIRQGKKEVVLFDRQYPRASFFSGGLKTVEAPIKIDTAALGLSDGPAEFMVAARDYSLWQWARGNQAIDLRAVTLDTKPPRLRVIDLPTVIKQGGAGIVIYGANEPLVHHGVTIDGVFHPGYPVPGRKGEVFGAMIAIPYDTDAPKSVAITAQDQAGNAATLPISLRVRAVPKRIGTINLSDHFLEVKMPEFAQHYPAMKGTPVEQYLFVNREVRDQNDVQIRKVCATPDAERHWQGRFLRLERGAPMAGYADYRTYFYQGKEVDHQVHLGVDLASVQNAKVQAANNGRVAFADYLGIYGNAIIIDHGQGVFSLYAHLSELKVKPGDVVKTGDEIGLTGTTGMAGGDHLHFAMLVNGVFVTPVEWWDEHWIRDNIDRFLTDGKE